MDVITLYVGQGDLSIVRHNGEAIIIDSHLPDCLDGGRAALESRIASVVKNHAVSGLVLTGFDADHCCPAGVEAILSSYMPDWVMYPKYYKDTDCAAEVFEIIEKARRSRAAWNPLQRVSVRLDQLSSRLLSGLSYQFILELFSPHVEDCDNSNNSSIVLKITGVGDSYSYLVTGDTEIDRWDRISQLFGTSLKSDVLSAPHHGSRNGAHPESLILIGPNTVLISAGVDNQYGHPHPQAVRAYSQVADHVFTTNVEGGVTLVTKRNGSGFETLLAR
jgi:competence protein ComEC